MDAEETIVGNYKLGKTLGVGSFGKVKCKSAFFSISQDFALCSAHSDRAHTTHAHLMYALASVHICARVKGISRFFSFTF